MHIAISGKPLDCLIVCGQGTYRDGRYYGEFHDRDIYLGHAATVRQVVETYKYELVVVSGGYTQEADPRLSEAESFPAMWQDTGSTPTVPVVLDECALDSPENIICGLMSARWRLLSTPHAQEPFRRVGAYVAWKFKKWRFNLVAQSLGIVERFYFHGYADSSETNVQVPESWVTKPGGRCLLPAAAPAPPPVKGVPDARSSDEKFKREVFDHLLLLRSDSWDEKRRGRWQGNAPESIAAGFKDYADRFTVFGQSFPETIKGLETLRQLANGSGQLPADAESTMTAFRRAFASEVMKWR